MSTQLPLTPFGYSPGVMEGGGFRNRYPLPADLGMSSDSSTSPDSLYSSESDHVPDQPFVRPGDPLSQQYTYEEEEVDEVDAADYETFDPRDQRHVTAGGWSPVPITGWPVEGDEEEDWATCSPKGTSPRKLSIISTSPRGSVTSIPSGRRESESLLKTTLVSQSRRASNPSLFDSHRDRRRSSSKSASSSRRKSSVISWSALDPLEQARYTNLERMNDLSRRFSEVIEVTQQDRESARGSIDQVAMARLAFRSRERASADTLSSCEDSEILTVSYAPTPNPYPTQGPLSNYPLFSVAATRDQDRRQSYTTLDYESDNESLLSASVSASSPAPPVRRQPQGQQPLPLAIAPSVAPLSILTPPPPSEPLTMWKARIRPSLLRNPTTGEEYQFPQRTPAVPAGMTRPRLLNRSVSAPFFSSAASDTPYAQALALRAAGTFPLARAPIGATPLRASTRRDSVMSILSDVSPAMSRRPSMLAEPRMSISSWANEEGNYSSARRHAIPVEPTTAGERRHSNTEMDSVGSRRESATSSLSRYSRQSSLCSLPPLRKGRSSIDLRRESLDRRASIAAAAFRQSQGNLVASGQPAETEERRRSSVAFASSTRSTSRRKSSQASSERRRSSLAAGLAGSSSRKGSHGDTRRSSQLSKGSGRSSIVSIGEYGYLGPEISVASLDHTRANPPVGETVVTGRSRPDRIVLPRSENDQTLFMISNLEEVVTPTATGRYSPLDNFYSRSTLTSTTSGNDSANPHSPLAPNSTVTPKAMPRSNTSTSVMDRPRPISPPEFLNYFPFPPMVLDPPSRPHPSSMTSQTSSQPVEPPPSVLPMNSESTPDRPLKSILRIGGTSRKAVPALELEQEAPKVREEVYRQAHRRGAMERFFEDSVDPLEVPCALTGGGRAGLKRSTSFNVKATGSNTISVGSDPSKDQESSRQEGRRRAPVRSMTSSEYEGSHGVSGSRPGLDRTSSGFPFGRLFRKYQGT